MHGLLDRDIDYIIKAVQSINSIEEVRIFGSRALGNYKKASDVDLAIVGKNITKQDLFKVQDLLEEVYPLPYFFDIVHYESIISEELIEHINRYGKQIWKRQ